MIGWRHDRHSHHRPKLWSSLSWSAEVMICIFHNCLTGQTVKSGHGWFLWQKHRANGENFSKIVLKISGKFFWKFWSHYRHCHDRLKSWSTFFTIAKLDKLWNAAMVGFYGTITGQTLKISRKFFFQVFDDKILFKMLWNHGLPNLT